jgi:hypothetical protein
LGLELFFCGRQYEQKAMVSASIAIPIIKEGEFVMKHFYLPLSLLALLIVFLIGTGLISGEEKKMPFGGEKDVAFAENIWMAMKGYEQWPMRSGFYQGTSPHGKVLRLYYNMVNVDDQPYHVIVKDNFGGQEATVKNAAKAPNEYLAAVTIMVQRRPGYDPDNNNWFWAKYLADGSLDKNAKGMKLAGRVAKGMNAGCIACHAKAGDNDYVFTND